MDGHFDFNDFHPTFLSNEGWSGLGGFGDFFQPHMNDFLQQAHEFDLPADVIHNALGTAVGVLIVLGIRRVMKPG